MMVAIIFDWGGVLAPSDCGTAAMRLAKNFDFDQTAFIDYFELHEDDLAHTKEFESFLIGASKVSKIPIPSIINALNAALPDEVFSLAKNISKKYEVYILSNQLHYRTEYIKSKFDLSFCKGVFFSSEIGLKKPQLAFFEHVLSNIGHSAKDCLFIDDRQENLDAAKKVGITGILFKNLEILKEDLKSHSIDLSNS